MTSKNPTGAANQQGREERMYLDVNKVMENIRPVIEELASCLHETHMADGTFKDGEDRDGYIAAVRQTAIDRITTIVNDF